MPIHFRCLNCGIKILAEDDEAGDVCECEKCGVTFTVPQPIGGKLTEKRLESQFKLPQPANAPLTLPASLPEEQAEENSEEHKTEQIDTNEDDSVPEFHFDPRNVPQYGFEIQIQIENEVYGRTERLWVEDSAEFIRQALRDHLALFPQYFDRGLLMLNFRRWSVTPDGYDINLRLFGLVDGEEFSEYFYAQPASHDRPSQLHIGGLIGFTVGRIASLLSACARGVARGLLGIPLLRMDHLRLRKKAARELKVRLDLSVGKPVSFWKRF